MNSITSINKLDFSQNHKQQSVSKMSADLSDLDEESPNSKLPDDTDCEPDQETSMIKHAINSGFSLGESDVGLALNSRLSSDMDFNCSQGSSTVNCPTNSNCSLDKVDVDLECLEENQNVVEFSLPDADESKV